MDDLTKREQEHAAFGSGIFCPNKNVFHVSRARGLHVRPTLAIVWRLWRQGISHVCGAVGNFYEDDQDRNA